MSSFIGVVFQLVFVVIDVYCVVIIDIVSVQIHVLFLVADCVFNTV